MQAISGILRVKINGAYVITLNFVIDVYTCYAQHQDRYQISLNVFKDSY